MSPIDLTNGLAGFATLHPLFTLGPAVVAALLINAALRRPRATPRRARVGRR